MSASAIQDTQAVARPKFVQKALHGKAIVSSSAHEDTKIFAVEAKPDPILESGHESEALELADQSSLAITRVDVTKLFGVLRQLQVMARQPAPRIAFKVKRRIVFLDLNEILAVHAEGNYVSFRRRPHPYLLRESISSIAEKFKSYGFVRIHRSVVVNASAVEEVRPLPTGEYSLLLKGNLEYTVTRTYKDNLRDLAQLWVGSECPCR